MMRFFFHSGGGVHRDADGTELADARTARVQATQLLGQLLKDQAEELADMEMWSLDVSVEDRAGGLSFAVAASTDCQRPK